MSKILFEKEWFEEISPTALYESDFERIVIEQASLVFPDYYVSNFKTVVFSEADTVKPDLALIDRGYRGWWVVEIEMSYHSLSNHVLPQLAKLSSANYTSKEAEYLHSHNRNLDLTRLHDLIKGKPPRIMLLLNSPKSDWIYPVQRYGAIISIFEIFRSERNKHIFRINGEYPRLSKNVLTECYPDPIIPRFLVIESPASLNIPPRGKTNIIFNNCITTWDRIDAQNKVWLSPSGLNPLPKKSKFALIQQDDGSLTFEEINAN